MHPDIAARFEKLEDRRKALVERVRALPEDKQKLQPARGEFSPVEVLAHMALAENFDLEQMKKMPPSELKGKRPKPSFIFRNAIKKMSAAQKLPTFGAMTPAGDFGVDQAAKDWEYVRQGLRGYFEQVESPSDPIARMKLFGVLSASD